jgi:hypothetical protein
LDPSPLTTICTFIPSNRFPGSHLV